VGREKNGFVFFSLFPLYLTIFVFILFKSVRYKEKNEKNYF